MTAPDAPRTVGAALAAAEAELAAAGVASPRADAEALALHCSRRSRADLLLSRNDSLDDGDPLASALPDLVRRRAAREPLQHILGTAPMMGLELAVGPGVFVPRPETELMVDEAAGVLREMIRDGVRRPVVVDLCTGSGAIALAVADLVPSARVVGVEKSDAALEWALRNAAVCRRRWEEAPGPERDVSLVSGDVTDPAILEDGGALAGLAGLADVVLSNPPYVPEPTPVDPEVRADPHDAVFAGETGLDVIRPMMGVVRALLRPGGFAAVEHDDDGAEGAAAAFADAGGFRGVACRRDLAGRDRYTTARRA
ncbi:peptide chain release factor N(5)-glutamine methyltransferase [Corynebacterium sp. 335C]